MLLDFPSNREEGWRWTDFAALSAAAQSSPVAGAIDPAPLFLDLPGPKLVFIDGELDDARSDAGRLNFMKLTYSGEHPLGQRTSGRLGPIIVLGQESDGDCVQIVHVGTGGENHLPAHIALDEDVPASIVETFVGTGWTNRLSRVTLERGARLMRATRLLQDDGFVSLRDEAVIGRGASLVSTFLAAGGAGTRIDGLLELRGEGAFAEASGALLGAGRQRHDVNVVLRHDVPNGMSRQVWRSVADDRATCSIAARVEVARDAQRTDGEQSLKGLLLDRGATINAKPELEIFADDVKCAHGATVGELDRNALFYLESRGVAPDEAKGLLTRAFVADALDRIGEEKVREAFYKDAEQWFTAEKPLPFRGGVGVGPVTTGAVEPTTPTPGPSPEGEG